MKTLQFEPWPNCRFSTLFWKSLAAKKLEEFQKGRTELTIKTFYNQSPTQTAHLFFSAESFDEQVVSVAEIGTNFKQLTGKLLLCDTIEEFKALDRPAEALRIAESNATCAEYQEINHFVIFAFADVKKFKFYHQIAFPVQLFSDEQITWTSSDLKIDKFSNSTDAFEVNLDKNLILFHDNSIITNVPGWPLRQLLVNLSVRKVKEIIVACFRGNDSQFCFKAHLPDYKTLTGITGWERSATDPSKIAPVKVTDLSALIDPVQLAKQAGELNLKLMKWRLVPDLDLDRLTRTSCLLIGAGTLGCNVLRILLGWGFRRISLVDSGKVSYSNPIRQSLFTFEDAKAAAPKAQTAAIRALQIDPNAQITGHELTVPMPGHAIINEIESKESFDKLNELIQDHDVVFLLTDSRESRWLPALLGHFHKKVVMTVGLGFDSFVVMRHGMRNDSSNKSSCYFCHDVIGPSDSLTGRSLDQQCTVTRPGLSFMASALAVELLVSLLQQDDLAAEHNYQSRLGKLPHQIRGNLANQEVFSLTGKAFEHCTCCSEVIMKEFLQRGFFEFVKLACNYPGELEKISGLTEMKTITQEISDLVISDSSGEEDDF